MSIAKYFSKDLLAINQLLKSNQKDLEDILNKTRIGIAFDNNAVETEEGNKSLDLCIRLISRLYPRISIVDLSNHNNLKIAQLASLARKINSSIEIDDKIIDQDAIIIAGSIENKINYDCKTFFIGSDKWNAKFSITKPQRFEDSTNPFGCGFATCIAVSNVFRFVFRHELPVKDLDSDFVFSTLNCCIDDTDFNPELNEVNFLDTVLVGLGAIGNGTIWGLSNLPILSGQIDLVDNESITASNLQRYILASEDDIESFKVETFAGFFQGNKLLVNSFKMNWDGYIKERGDYNVNNVGVAIDNKKDRIGIQSSLPKRIFNSYTETNLLGIARHTDFINSSCLACGYIPFHKEKNYINEVADNCNIPNLSNAVKDYINLNLSVDEINSPQNTASLLDIIAQANNIGRDKLVQFHGKKVNEFYSEFICGGLSLTLSNKENKISNVDAPLAFQSALAGILLAAELVIESNNIRKNSIKQLTHYYPLNPIGYNNPFNHTLEKDNSGRCFCRDKDFIDQYRLKWLEK